MRTIIYIDGYNLYYSRLRRTSYLWIDVVKLSKTICRIQFPEISNVSVKYFTAPVLTRIASYGEAAQKSQMDYIRAHETLYPDCFECIKGYYSMVKDTPIKYQKPINKDDRVSTWKLEEKQTDVNIATHMYRDALVKKSCDQVVLLSGDTDLAAPLKYIREDSPDIKIGLILPGKPKEDGVDPTRPKPKYLDNYSHWTRNIILDSELEDSLLPEKITTNKGPIRKPDYW